MPGVERQRPQGRPWGLTATAALAAVVFAAFISVQFLTEVLFLRGRTVSDPEVATYDHFGFLLAIATLLAAPVGIGLIILFANLRRGIGPVAYLGLIAPPRPGLWRWLLYLALFMAFFHAVEYALGRPFVTEFQVRAFTTAGSTTLLLLAIVVVAPAFEELFFRGFIFAGVAGSRLGPTGGVLVTSALWSVVHVQYELIEIAMIFAGGLLLGWARWQTGSVYVPAAVHGLWNLISAVETMVYLALDGS